MHKIEVGLLDIGDKFKTNRYPRSKWWTVNRKLKSKRNPEERYSCIDAYGNKIVLTFKTDVWVEFWLFWSK